MLLNAAQPTTAERVRTVCARAGSARLVTEGGPPTPCPVFALLTDGSFALTAPDAVADAMAPEEPVVLELLDHAPGGESVRALVWVRGRVRPAPAHRVRQALDAMAAADPNPALLDVGFGHRLLRLHVDSIVFADATGAETVDRCAVLAARPDPFCHAERAWVRHLGEHHPDMVERLRLHLPRSIRRGRLRLLGLDRYGLQLRISRTDGEWEARVPFFSPVSDETALCRALRLLMGCPFSNALRTRPLPR